MKKISVNCRDCESKDCSVMRYCDEKWLEFLNQRKKVMSYKKGQQIIYERTTVDGIFFILSGKAKVYKTGVGGKQQIVRLAKSGDILGHRGLNKMYWPISASTLEDSYLCFIEKNDFETILKNNSTLTYQLLLFFADELVLSEEIARDLAQSSVREKMAAALLKIKNVFSPGSGKSVGVQLSRQEIADIAGTTKEQVSKNLADFKKEKLIQLSGKDILIHDIERLKVIANHPCS